MNLARGNEHADSRPTRMRLALSVTAFLLAFDAAAAVAAFPALSADFAAASASELGWVLNAYTLLFAALLIPAGRWADQRGHAWALRGALMVFFAAGAAAALAPGLGWLVVARGVQGAAAAVASPAAFALLLRGTAKADRASAVGIAAGAGALGAALGPGLGSALMQASSWRAVFGVSGALALILFGCIWRLGLPDTKAKSIERPDWIGAVALVVGIAGPIAAWSDLARVGVWGAVHVGGILGGLVLLTGCVAWSWRRPRATLNLAWLGKSPRAIATVGTVLFGAAFGLMFLSFFVFMTRVWHYSQMQAGLIAMLGPLVVATVALLSGKLAAVFTQRQLWIAGGLLFGLGHVWYAVAIADVPNYLGVWLPGQMVTGAAIGLLLPALATTAVSEIAANELAHASAFNTAARQIGSMIGVAVGTHAIAPDAGIAEFRLVYAGLAIAGFMLAGIALGLDAGLARPPASWRERAEARPRGVRSPPPPKFSTR